MKNIKLSAALLCMGLAGCSLPFFGQKDAEKKIAPVEMEEQGETSDFNLQTSNDGEVKPEKEIFIKQDLDELDSVLGEMAQGEKEDQSLFPLLVGAIQASVFEEEILEEEELSPKEEFEKLLKAEKARIINEGYVDDFDDMVEFSLNDLNQEDVKFIPNLELLEEMDENGVAQQKEVDSGDEITEAEWDLFEQLEKEVRQAEQLLELESPELIDSEAAIPAGALPSTGGAGPLATLWGWVKSWLWLK